MLLNKIAVIGGGHMGRALVLGILRGKKVSAKNLILSTPHPRKLVDLKSKYHITLTTDNIEAVKGADIIIIAVRPKIVSRVISQIRRSVRDGAIVVSVAISVPFRLLRAYFQTAKIKLVRIMPNVPVAFGRGVVGWIANNRVDVEEKRLLKELFDSLGYALYIKTEEQINTLSMISGSGIGYVAYFMRCLEEAAIRYGFSSEEVSRIIPLTVSGTVDQVKNTGVSLEKLVESVATRGGITEEVIRSLKEKKWNTILSQSIDIGYSKIGKLTKEIEKLD